MERIDTEAKRNSKLITDLDNFRSRYHEFDIETGNHVVFPSGEIYTYEHWQFVMLSEATVEEFNSSWTMRPDYCSYDMYGTVVHWPLILFINNIYSIEEFKDLDTVLVPPYSLIVRLVRFKVPRDEIEEVNKFQPLAGIGMFHRSPFDDIEKARIYAKGNIESSEIVQGLSDASSVETSITIVEYNETLILDSTTLASKNWDLTFVPMNVSSVTLYVDDFNVPQKYGYDYVIKTDGTSNKRISWNPEDCFSDQSTFVNTLESGVKLRVEYLYTSGSS